MKNKLHKIGMPADEFCKTPVFCFNGKHHKLNRESRTAHLVCRDKNDKFVSRSFEKLYDLYDILIEICTNKLVI